MSWKIAAKVYIRGLRSLCKSLRIFLVCITGPLFDHLIVPEIILITFASIPNRNNIWFSVITEVNWIQVQMLNCKVIDTFLPSYFFSSIAESYTDLGGLELMKTTYPPFLWMEEVPFELGK